MGRFNCVEEDREWAINIMRRLNQTRATRGLSQADLARAVGVDPSQISRMFSGDSPITLDRVRTLARAVDMPLAELLEDSPPKPEIYTVLSGTYVPLDRT